MTMEGAMIPSARKRPQKREPRVADVWDADVVTVMVRQIPTKLTQLNFLQEVRRHGFDGLFNFLYIPFDLKKNSNVGYGFINFVKPEYALQFRDKLDGMRLGHKGAHNQDQKAIRIHPASFQGYEANYNHFSGTKTAQKHDPRISPLFFKHCPFNGMILEGDDMWTAQLNATLLGSKDQCDVGLENFGMDARKYRSLQYPYGWSAEGADMNNWEGCAWEASDYDPNATAYSGWGEYESPASDCQINDFAYLLGIPSNEDHDAGLKVDKARAPPGFAEQRATSRKLQTNRHQALMMESADLQKNDIVPEGTPDFISLLERTHKVEERPAKLEEDPVSWDSNVVTVMVRQLPSHYTQLMFLNMVRKGGFEGHFNFVYVPFDFTKRKNIGYGFINFTRPQDALRFRDNFDGVFLDEKCKKPLHIHPALLQGYEANYEHFVRTKVAQMQDPRVSPIFLPKGNDPLPSVAPSASDPMRIPIPESLLKLHQRSAFEQHYVDVWSKQSGHLLDAPPGLGMHVEDLPKISASIIAQLGGLSL